MTQLKYKFTNDTLFKMVFVRNQNLLKRLVAVLLRIHLEDIGEFTVTNPEMPPESMSEKFCRLDINMMVNCQVVDLEIQVNDEKDYPERSLYYWAREYSSALSEGKKYLDLPKTIIISIVAFKLFNCEAFHSEFEVLEINRHERLTDRLNLHYFELPKIPEIDGAHDELNLWLSLFKAETEEELVKIESIGGEIMEQAVSAYRRVSGTKEFQELERLRFEASCNEAAALANAEQRRSIEIAKTLKAKGMPVDEIAEITKLTVDEVILL